VGGDRATMELPLSVGYWSISLTSCNKLTDG
jgi:hypothetical protein